MPSRRAGAPRRALSIYQLTLRIAALVIAAALALPFLVRNLPGRGATATSAFSFNWTGTPSAPQPWAPGMVDDWDLISNIDGPTDQNGLMNGGHGAACEAPPATHQIRSLGDAAYICKNHLMTAIDGGETAYATYGSVYFAPAQMLDWSQGSASLSWMVSTERLSSRDFWSVNLTPFDQNMVLPLAPEFPAYHGEPQTGIELRMDNTSNCGNAGFGSVLRVFSISGTNLNELTQYAPCVESTVPPSFSTRTKFQVDISQGHLRVSMPGTTTVWYDGPINASFTQAVVQFSHHSYHPEKGENPDGSAGLPNTYHWSDISMSSATPFVMLRPVQPQSIHDGNSPQLGLPDAAPQNAFLRFAAMGNLQVSFDGGRSFQAPRSQGATSPADHFASFWTPIPKGATQVLFKGQPNSLGQPWWVQDVSVWANTAPSGAPAPPPSTPTPTPVSTPTATPTPVGTPTANPTPTPSAPAKTPTPVPSAAPTPNPSPTPIATPIPTPSASPIPAPPPPPAGTSPVAFRSASTAEYAGVVRRPARVAQGDLLLAALEVDADPVQVQAPAGWTLIQDTPTAIGTERAFHALLYYKIAGAQEPATYTFSATPAVWTDVQILDYAGASTSHPIDAVAGRDAGITRIPQSPSVSTSTAHDRLVLIYVNYEFGRWNGSLGMTERTDFDSNAAFDLALNNAGPSGGRTAIASKRGPIAALAVALRPR